MGNRCNNCNKMVGLDNGEPTVENIEAEWDQDEFSLTAQVTGTRVCQDCSDEMKTLSMDMEGTVKLEAIEDFKKLTPERQELVRTALKDGEAEISIDGSGGDVSEGGGGRYKKNIITTTIDYDLTVSVTVPDGEDIELSHSGNLQSENAASEFEDNY